MKKSLVTALRCCVLISLAMSAGCSIPRALWSQADSRYTAVKIKDWEAPVPPEDDTIRVLLVHGMSNFPFGNPHNIPNLLGCGAKTYAELSAQLATAKPGSPEWTAMLKAIADPTLDWNQFITDAARQLGHEEDLTADCQLHTVPDPDPTAHRILGYTYTRTFKANAKGVKLKFYIANWGLASAVLKEKTFGSWGALTTDDPGANGYTAGEFTDFDKRLSPDRAPLNYTIKLNVMDWGLGDAALYLGDAKEQFRLPVRYALKQLLAESSPNDRLAIVTHSLGSTIAFDVVRQQLVDEHGGNGRREHKKGTISSIMLSSQKTTLKKPGKPDESKTASNVVFYMFANQYGLLKMGNDKSLANLNNELPRELHDRGIFLQIYAFTDPNDLLSYPLNINSNAISTCNVYVRNPGFSFGFLTEPLESHLNYKINPSVLKAMLNGPDDVILPKQ